MSNEMNDLFFFGLNALVAWFCFSKKQLLDLCRFVDVKITYLFPYATSVAAMTDLTKYETKQRAIHRWIKQLQLLLLRSNKKSFIYKNKNKDKEN